MTQNSSIDQIKQKEAESDKKIASAQKKEEDNRRILKAEQEENLNNAQNQLGKENEQVLKNAKSQIEEIKTKGQAKLKEEMAALDNIPGKKMSEAVEKVVTSISE
ncbi:hypothetical protein KKC88_02015 [Patescibacteria group bacterium]|nr:hypothetical protein [Patescibacteria group bacterium]MBU1673493.1 hypothetical protein [Patescibacteria group bacterium]MBU1963761.1 hypothetical protein [Patescibacteria group bacterium]